MRWARCFWDFEQRKFSANAANGRRFPRWVLESSFHCRAFWVWGLSLSLSTSCKGHICALRTLYRHVCWIPRGAIESPCFTLFFALLNLVCRHGVWGAPQLISASSRFAMQLFLLVSDSVDRTFGLFFRGVNRAPRHLGWTQLVLDFPELAFVLNISLLPFARSAGWNPERWLAFIKGGFGYGAQRDIYLLL